MDRICQKINNLTHAVRRINDLEMGLDQYWERLYRIDRQLNDPFLRANHAQYAVFH